MAEGAKAAGASRVIGIDIDSKKFDLGTSSPSQYIHLILNTFYVGFSK